MFTGYALDNAKISVHVTLRYCLFFLTDSLRVLFLGGSCLERYVATMKIKKVGDDSQFGTLSFISSQILPQQGAGVFPLYVNCSLILKKKYVKWVTDIA